ncbi:MAG: flagellar biosynthesis protein FlhF [Gallionella sp.]|jgi:flagellar biosynthesis protein FlhF
MNIKKFIAGTAREALREVRNELGEEAIILSNRKTELGVEIVAMANDETVQLAGGAAQTPEVPAEVSQAVSRADAAVAPEVIVQSAPALTGEATILGEIKSMHNQLQKQIETLSWNNLQQRDPQRAGLLRRMLNSGFSTLLARQLLNKMPSGDGKGEPWIKQVLKRNLRVAGEPDDIVVKGGVYALIGPTGVGKTTTTAKLAARAVVRYGADKVALLTTDSYRIGAYEQLKIYGKILGVAVHAVRDVDDLRLTLSALRHKHLVLIDTVGMGQRDERVTEQNEMFDATGVARLLVLNSTSGGDTLEDVVRMYYSNKVIGCITTKLDEAANLGAVLDVVMRHRLVMYFMADGQRVPEDLHPVDIDVMLHKAFKPADQKTPFTMDEIDFPLMMTAEADASDGEVTYAL